MLDGKRCTGRQSIRLPPTLPRRLPRSAEQGGRERRDARGVGDRVEPGRRPKSTEAARRESGTGIPGRTQRERGGERSGRGGRKPGGSQGDPEHEPRRGGSAQREPRQDRPGDEDDRAPAACRDGREQQASCLRATCRRGGARKARPGRATPRAPQPPRQRRGMPPSRKGPRREVGAARTPKRRNCHNILI